MNDGLAGVRVCGTGVQRALDDARPRTILVSDLHVPTGDSVVLADFMSLLARARDDAAQTRLLVLGDLFEGIVNERQLEVGRWRDLTASLRATADAGVSVTVLHGNRDFMLGKRFARTSGCRVVPGGLAFVLGGCRTLALHGDELCVNDVPYQRSKRWLRSRLVRGFCAILPLAAAAAVGRKARSTSTRTMGQGDQRRFAPVDEAVGAAFAAGFDLLVFGHVHTPGDGELAAGGRYCVLPAFDDTAVFLQHDPGVGLRFVSLAGSPPRYGPLDFAPRLAPS
ncbi:MAG: UDP-2,3-diacylglucosamine diphosphatase [Planctomycetota bacterium]